MRSVTSYFNPTLYKKNLSRFWPLWVSWLVLWLFLLPLNLLNLWNDCRRSGSDQESVYRFFRDCLNQDSMAEVGVVFGMVYAVLVVMAVFGYLFNHRSAATMHALPMRRENLFLTNYLSGITFFLVPNAVAFALAALAELVTLPAELSAIAMPCLWSGFWVCTGAQLFFYSFAVFCAQFTGNVLALPAFYGILNLLVYVMYALCTELGGQIFYGGWPIMGEPTWVRLLTPVYALIEATQWNYVGWDQLWDVTNGTPAIQELELGFEDPGLVAGYALAGVVLAALALLLYRRRHIETAGDVVSVKIVRPIFRAGVAVCAGLCGGLLTVAFFGWQDSEIMLAVFIVAWTLVGFFAAEMLLQKSFRVFKRSWKSGLVTTAVMAAALACCFLDVFGVETWTPKIEDVDNALIEIHNTYPYDDGSYLNQSFSDKVEVEKIIDLHQAIIDDYKEHGEMGPADSFLCVYLNYEIGGQVYRKSYYSVSLLQNEINVPGTTTYLVDQYVNDPAMIEAVYELEQARESKIVCAELESVLYPTGRFEDVQLTEGAEELWAAVQADFADGNLGHRYLFEDDVRREETYYTDLTLRFLIPEAKYAESMAYDLEYERYVEGGTVQVEATRESEYSWNHTMTVTLTPKAQRTLAVLAKYSDLGGAYDIAQQDGEPVYLD